MNSEFPRLTVDGIIIIDNEILLIKRKNDPFRNQWALPGGFVEYGETTTEAVCREINEETGLHTEIISLFGVYSDPRRDPRGHTVSIVYLLKKNGGELHGGDDASDARFFPLDHIPDLAFDHAHIITDVIRRKNHVLPKM
jgi:8-oxo-dGTP diphosphatase